MYHTFMLLLARFQSRKVTLVCNSYAHSCVSPCGWQRPAGYRISVFHTFTDEVGHYRKHHWTVSARGAHWTVKCQGRTSLVRNGAMRLCQKRRPVQRH